MARTKWIFGAQQSQSGKDSTDPVILPTNSSADAKKIGLENFGNTCYANSVIQALYFCAPFRDLLIQSVDHSLSQIALEQLPPPSPIAPLAPVRKKPDRKPSTSGSTTDVPNGVGHPPNHVLSIPPNPPSLFSALRSLFVYISSQPTDKGTVAPRAFIEKLREVKDVFRGNQHQDAHEFLNYLLNKIVEEIEEDRKQIRNLTLPLDDLSNSITTLTSKIPPTVTTTTTSSNSGSSPDEATLVHKLFEGILTSETRCLTCETVSSRDESFLDLSIDIEQNASVTACLRSFSASEMLCQKNKFFCDFCCDLQEAEKRMKIKKLPNVLALHLKRFKVQEDLGKYIKLTYRVAFPFELRLFNTVDETDDADRLFDLFGIVVHIGNGPHHGHYISIIKTQGSWQVFDDENVSPIAESEIPKYFGESNAGSAYILYYQAADIDLPALGLRTFQSESEQPLSFVSGIPPASPSQHSIRIPAPGADEADSSDLSDPAYPLTPSQTPSPLLTFADKPPRHIEVTTSLADESAVSGGLFASPLPITPTQSTRPSKPSIFNSIRRTPSSKLSGGPDPARSADVDPPPPMPPMPPPPNLPPASPVINGKIPSNHKEPERKPSLWFPGKRKSLRASEKKSASEHDVPPSPMVALNDSAQTSSAPTTWFRSANQSKDHKQRRRPSEPSFFDVSGFANLAPLPQRPKSSIYDSLTVKPTDGFESPSPGSASSSFGSTSMQQYSFPPDPVPPQGDISDFPPPRKSSLGDTRQPEHKKSVPNLPKDRSQTVHTTRPVSASGPTLDRSTSVRRPLPLPPVPPLPPSIAAPGTVPPLLYPNGLTDEPDDYVLPEKGKISVDESSTPFPGTTTTYPSTTTAPSPPNNHKRATRKLSMTGQIMTLGFGKKDKKEKEGGGKVGPSAFNTPFGGGGKS